MSQNRRFRQTGHTRSDLSLECNERQFALAKITPPCVSNLHPRPRLFRALDQARRKHPILWLSAPGGAGKTTLVASYAEARRLPLLWYQVDAGDNDPASFFYYLGLAAKAATPRHKPLPLLTAEYVGGFGVFATNYFRELFARLKRPGLLVFDNYQDLAPSGPMQDILARGFAEIPPELTVIVASRETPPPTLARERAAGRLHVFGWEELKLTAAESHAIVRRRTRTARLSRETLERLYQRTQGWVAGLVLLSEQAERGIASAAGEDFTGETVFDYFAQEIFRHAEPNVQRFLLKTAFLPKIKLSIAQALTAEPNAEAILGYLTRRNLFTVRHTDGSFEYHPLFRGFLAAQAPVQFAPDELQAIKCESARLLAQAGDIDQAVALLLQTAEHAEDALALILEHAKTFVATGRTKTLEEWLNALPDASRENAWVLYWLGACRLAFAPAEARGCFERAFVHFEAQDDASPLYLTWSGIVESYVLERAEFTPMRPWLERYHTLAGDRAPPDRDIETASLITYVLGLISTAFDHPDLPLHAKRVAERLACESRSDRWLAGMMTLVPFYAWRGDLFHMRSALDRLATYTQSPEASPLAALSWYAWACLYEGAIGAVDVSLKAMRDGLALAERTGIHVLDTQLLGFGIWGQLCAGEVATARGLLQQLAPLIGERRVGRAYYNCFASLVSLAEGDLPGAVAEARQAAQLARESGLSVGEMTYPLALAFMLAAQGTLDEAADILADARRLAIAMDSRLYTGYAALCDACIHHARGAHAPMLAALKQALERMREAGVVLPAYLPRDKAAALYAVALEHDIESEYLRIMIPRARLAPPADTYPERWPWPVRIYTLGRFEVLKDGMPLVFAGRAHRKPLELLRALMAFGGREVSLVRLAQALWPDTEADTALTALETTLHRLRKLLGENAILMQERRLSLNGNYCWIDSVALIRRIEQSTGTAAARVSGLLDLYRGAFLEGDEAPWAIVERERLRAKFLRAVLDLGAALERDEGGMPAAILAYERGVEADPLASELYLRLMKGYRRSKRPAEALAVYRRCYAVLTSTLQIEPGAEMAALYREIETEADLPKESRP